MQMAGPFGHHQPRPAEVSRRIRRQTAQQLNTTEMAAALLVCSRISKLLLTWKATAKPILQENCVTQVSYSYYI